MTLKTVVKVVPEAANQTIDSHHEQDIIIYSDGSCKDGTKYGAATVVTTGSEKHPIELEVQRTRRKLP